VRAIARAAVCGIGLPLLGWLALAGGCGRLDFDARTPPSDASIDVAITVALCPAATTPIAAGSTVCIEQARRGSETWTDARASCMALGRRLCADAEWFEACTMASGLTDMVNDGYEWVAEQSSGVAQKRGASGCTDMSSHEIFVDPYGFRCCLDR
jgi:hypothetical protein